MERITMTAGLILIMLSLLMGCSETDTIIHNYTFVGENELWTATLKVDGTERFTEDEEGRMQYESECKDDFTLTYKNHISDLSSAKKLKISYKCSVGGGAISTESPHEKSYRIQGASNGAMIRQDETILVTIDLDGEIQTFELLESSNNSENLEENED